jgi:hypothetical protein
MTAKIAEVRVNKKANLVQIKMNKGANHVLKDDKATRFINRSNEHYLLRVDNESLANLMAAEDYIAGRLQ